MAAPNDIVGYQYQADVYCAEHIIEAMIRGGIAAPAARGNVEKYGLEATLDELADAQAIDREGEHGFDSGDFPKIIFRDQTNKPDGDDAGDCCGSCGIELTDEPAVGWLAAADVRRDVDSFLDGYMECAVWSSSDIDTGEPLDNKFSTADINATLRAKMRQECAAFVRAHYDDLVRFTDLTGRDMGSNGHDLWLTRNGHGAGYWDRYLEAPRHNRDAAKVVGDRLSEAARVLGEDYLAELDGELNSL